MNSQELDFTRLVSTLQGKKILFLSHVRPDTDTLASAMSLAYFFSSISDPTFGITEPLSDGHAQQTSFFPIQPKVIQSLRGFDAVVCVDFRSPSQAGPLSRALVNYVGKIVIIDHHHPSSNEFSHVSFSLIRPHSVAAAQLVAQLGDFMRREFTPAIASALAMAIVTDSARFMVANPDTFAVFSFLLDKSGRSYEELFTRAVPTSPIHERVGVFHALKQARLVSAGDFLLASVSMSHQTSQVANALIQMGADIGLSVSHSKEGVYSSIRISGRVRSELGMDAVLVGRPLAEKHEGTCGGHARAAQLNLPPYFSEQMIIDHFSRELFMRVKKSHPHAVLKIH